MTKITVAPDCGNAPRKVFLKDLNIAFATGNADFIIDHVSNDITWVMHGDKTVKGKEGFIGLMNILRQDIADELILHNIITHGREAAANGEMIMGTRKYSFCDVYHFTNTTSSIIKEMHSYVIETKVNTQ